jgi:hypothetical protein
MTTSMSALLSPPPDDRLWSSMPGWGIVADLTPPELIASRHLKVLRKLIILGLVLVLVLCAGGFALAIQKHSSASSTRDAIDTRTRQLQSQLHSKSFRNVVRMQGTVAQVQGQVSSLMKNDVDLASLIARLRDALPASMSVNSLAVTLNPEGAPTPGAAGTTLDTSGHPVIGTVTIAGSARTLNDLPAYVDDLATLKGVVNLVPTSNQADKGVAEFSLSFGLTDKLYSHQYDASTTGSK